MFTSIVVNLLLASSLVQASNVIDLTPANFDSVVGQGKPALVEFFAPWCGHCKALAPVYEKLADSYSYTDDVIIARVNADAERSLGMKYGIKGFPTIKWFNKDGIPEDYQGGRALKDLTRFVKKKSGLKSKRTKKSGVKSKRTKKSGAKSKSKPPPPPPPAVSQLNYTSLEETILDPTKHVLVAFTASSCSHCKSMKPTFEQVAKNFKPEKSVVIANFESDAELNRPLAEKYEIKSFPTLKFFPKGSDKTPIVYEGGRTEKDFVNYLNEKCGTHRAVGGGLNDEAGRVAKLDDLAQEFLSTAPGSRKSIYETAVGIAGSSGKHYIRVMEKMLNGNAGYVEKETARLASILKKRTLSEDKLDKIKVKANILSAFAAQKVKAAAEAVESDAQVVKEEL